jgi:hypothetical protein
MLQAFALWLRATPFSIAIASHDWVIPAVQSVHIVTIAALIGSVLVINLRLLGLIERGQAVSVLMDHYLPVVGVSIAVLALTGAILIAGEPTRALFRITFWLKMALILAVLALTWGLSRLARSPWALAGGPWAGAAVKSGAVLALCLWVAVIFAGRWIGYTEGWPGAPQ